MGHSKGSSKREVCSNIILPQETRKTSHIQLILHLKQLETEEQNKTNKKQFVEGNKS